MSEKLRKMVKPGGNIRQLYRRAGFLFSDNKQLPFSIGKWMIVVLSVENVKQFIFKFIKLKRGITIKPNYFIGEVLKVLLECQTILIFCQRVSFGISDTSTVY